MNAPATPQEELPVPSLDAAQLESALGDHDLADEGFEDAMRVALQTAGGEMLFNMRMGGEMDGQWVAAVALGHGEDRHFAIVTVPEDGGALRVEPAEKSELPIARIAAAYAGVMDRLQAA